MPSWLAKLLRRRAPREALLNEGLGLAMDWGEKWLATINARLRERHPYLTSVELDELDATCRDAMRLGFEAVHAGLGDDATLASADVVAAAVRARHPWVDDANLARLRHQGVYYAAKTGRYARDP